MEPSLGAKATTNMYRIGVGFDTHVLSDGRILRLGGIAIPFEKGLLGHSDGDVALHATIDALLGAAGMGDIGRMFPDTDEQYKDIDSKELLVRVAERLKKADYVVENIDLKIVCERPKLAPYLPKMSEVVGRLLECENANVGATTTEGMNDEGKGRCISAHAVALLRKGKTHEAPSFEGG